MKSENKVRNSFSAFSTMKFSATTDLHLRHSQKDDGVSQRDHVDKSVGANDPDSVHGSVARSRLPKHENGNEH